MADIPWMEYCKAQKSVDKDKASIEFQINCFDLSSFRSADINIFSEASPINNRRVQSVEVTFTFKELKKIHFRLSHGSYDDDIQTNYFEISGVDNLWVNGITGRFNETLHTIRDQDAFLKKNKKLTMITSLILGTISFIILIDFLNKGTNGYVPILSRFLKYKGFEDSIDMVIAASFFGGLIGAIIGGKTNERVDALWPSIELQIGPEHTFTEKKRRQFYFLIASLIVIPLTLTILTTWL